MKNALLLIARLRGWWTNRPVLYGNGQQDETAAIQAYVNGQSVIAPNARLLKRQGYPVHFPQGTFLVKNQLHIRDGVTLVFD